MDGAAVSTGIGQPVRRREDLRLLTGKGRYSDDVDLPGQAYAVMVRSRHAHALSRSIDTAPARAMPGVLVVLTSEEVEADGLRPLPHISNSHPADIQIKNRDGSPTIVPQHQAIVGPEICHVGEIVAAVVAATLAEAKDAAEQITVAYEPLPAVTHALAAVEANAPTVRRNFPNVILDGDVRDLVAAQAAVAPAAHVLRLDTPGSRTGRLAVEPS